MNPMNLKNLPGYLEKLKKENKFDENLVVDIGTVSTPKFFTTTRAVLFFLSLFFLTLGSFAALGLFYSNKNIVIVLKAEELNSEEVSAILAENGAEIVSMEPGDNFSYKVKLEKLSNLKDFIERLKKNKSFQNVEVKTEQLMPIDP